MDLVREMKKPWYDKHRPTDFNGYIFKNDKTKAMIDRWVAAESFPHLLIQGSPGTGKTTLANLLIAHPAFKISPDDVLRLNAVRDNNIETVRSKIQSFCESGGWSGMRVVFMDEADNMSHAAQEAARTMFHDYVDSVRFILTGNFAHRFLDPIVSRCTTIALDTLDRDAFTSRLGDIYIIEADSVGYQILGTDIDVIAEIVNATFPDMRRAITALEEAFQEDGHLESGVSATKGADWTNQIAEIFATKDVSVKGTREFSASVRAEEMEAVYRWLYEQSAELFGENEDKAIFVISAALFRHGFSMSFPEINLTETILRLLALRK